MTRLDDHVLVALNDALGDEDTAWSLCQERADRWRREHVRPAAEKANSERQVKRLEAELANLNRQARRGVPRVRAHPTGRGRAGRDGPKLRGVIGR